MTFTELAELDARNELVDEVVTIDAVPGTRLVHLAVGQRAGLVLTREQAKAIGRDLLRVSKQPRGAPAVARPRAGRGARGTR